MKPSFATKLDSLQYDARLCSAQLLVVKGDLTRLQNSETKQHHKTGLKQRIDGALGTLEWLCRLHSHSTNLVVSSIEKSQQKEQFLQLRISFENKDWQGLNKKLDIQISKMPLNEESFSFQKLSRKTLRTSMSIYKHYCQACHTQPSDKSETPAYSLFEMAQRMPQEELLARLLVGVHGTPKIALRNPLTDDDITGLLRYFTKQTKK